MPLPHVITTSYLTHDAIADWVTASRVTEPRVTEPRPSGSGPSYPGPLLLSPGRNIGLRLVPMVRDLRFAWEEMPQQLLDDQAQKVRESLHSSLIAWAHQAGEAGNYTDNLPTQCLHPVGHWYELPNLFRNGVLARLLEERPRLRYLMLHNIDTLGADLNPELLGLHIESGAALTTEVIARQIDDRGGGLALPDERIEFQLSYYNSATYWIDLDRLLPAFSLSRADLTDHEKVAAAVR